LLPRTRHSQNHLNLDAPISSFEETGSRAAALDGARGTSFAAPTDHAQRHKRLHNSPHAPLDACSRSQLRRIRDATERTCRASRAVASPNVPSRGLLRPYSAPHETSMSALARRNTNLHTSGSSHRLSIIARQRTEVQGRGECTHVFSGSICTTRSFFPLCHPEKCHCNEV